MKQSVKLKPVLWDGLVAAVVVALALVCGVVIWGQNGESDQLTVVISVDGQEVTRCPLENIPDTEQIYSNNGYTLTIKPGKTTSGTEGIKVTESDCPTQDCVHTGMISRGGQSIVCLPARIIIQLVGGSANDDGPDLVIG